MGLAWTEQQLVDTVVALWRELYWVDCTDYHAPPPVKDEMMAAFLQDLRRQRKDLESQLAALVAALAGSAGAMAPGQEVELVAAGIINSYLKSLFKQAARMSGGRPSQLRLVEQARMLTRYRRFGDKTFEQAGVGQTVPSIGQQLAGKNIFNMEHVTDERPHTQPDTGAGGGPAA